MAKSDLVASINQSLPIRNGEFVTVGALVQVTQLAMTSPFVGDFQITDAGRLIVGADPNEGSRVLVSSGGLFGYDDDSVRTLAFFATSTPTYGAGDVVLGKDGGNYLRYDVVAGTLGLYSPAGAGLIAGSDGSLYAGDTDGAHMHWSSATRSLQIKNGADVKISLDATGDASFDGTIYARGGRIYNDMWVDGLVRAGDIDGPQVVLGRFGRTDDAGDWVESGEIIATDANNLPWFHVTAGGSTAGGGWFHLGGPGDYDQRLTYNGSALVVSGTVYAEAFELSGKGKFLEGSESISAGKFIAGEGNNVAVIDGGNDIWRIYAGNAIPEDAPFRVTQEGKVWLDDATVKGGITAATGTIGGWIIEETLLKSADTGARVQLDKGQNRVSIYDDVNEKVVMGYLDGLPRYDEDGNWGPDDYGFWALAGDTLVFDGDAKYMAGSWIVKNDGSYLIEDANENVIVRLGTDTGKKGLFVYNTGGTQLARFVSNEIFVGDETRYLQYTTAGGLNIAGSVTATSGTIGGWTINYDALYTNYYETGSVIISSDGYIILGSGDDLLYLTAADATYRLWVGEDWFNRDNAPFSVTKEGAIKATSGTVGGWTLGAASLTGGDATLHSTGYLSLGTGDNIARLDAADATYRLWIGDATAADAPFSVTKAGAVKATSGTIGGWILDTDLLKSAASGARLELNKTKNRISMFDAVNEKVAMGYLNGLAKNDGTGNWGAGDYGFWALAGDKLVIDGDGEYVSGDWIVMNDGAYLIQDADENTIVRLGTDTGEKGLFIYDTAATQLAKFISDEIFVGEATKYLKYTAANGLEIEGKITGGGGTVVIDEDGVMIEAYETSLGSGSENRLRIVDTSGGDLSYLAGVYGSSFNSLYLNVDESDSRNHFIYINTIAPSGYVASSSLVATYETDTNKAQVQAASNATYGVVNILSEYLVIDGELGLQKDAEVTIYGTTLLDQSDSSGAVPVLVLDQADVSEEMIEFVSTAGTGNAIEAVGSKTLTTTHFIKVTINGDTRYIPAGTIA